MSSSFNVDGRSMNPIKTSNIYVQVVDHLKNYIIENALQPGDRLPTETTLAEELGISRLSIREATKVMQNMGIVEIRQGHGTRVKALTMKPVTDHLLFWLDTNGITIREMATARSVLESSFMRMIIDAAEEDDYTRLEDNTERMRKRTERGLTIIETDMEFHQALAAATKNRVLQGFNFVLQEFFQHVSVHILTYSEDQWQTIEDHEKLCLALRQKKLSLAQQIIEQHLDCYSTFIENMPVPRLQEKV